MLKSTSFSVLPRCLWQTAVVRALVLVLVMTFVVPVSAFTTGLDVGPSGAAITSSTDIGSPGPTGNSLDDELVQHAHCMHSVARTHFKTLPIRRLTLAVPLPREADLQPSRALSSLPFKPPRRA